MIVACDIDFLQLPPIIWGISSASQFPKLPNFLSLSPFINMPNIGGNTTPAQRIQAISLAEAGIDKKIVAVSAGMTVSSVYRVIQKAKDKGYNKEESTVIKMKYVIDTPRSGRPSKATTEKEIEVLNSDKRYLRVIRCFTNKFECERIEMIERNLQQY